MPAPTGANSGSLVRISTAEHSIRLQVTAASEIKITLDGPGGYLPIENWDDMKAIANLVKDKVEAHLGYSPTWNLYGYFEGQLPGDPWTV